MHFAQAFIRVLFPFRGKVIQCKFGLKLRSVIGARFFHCPPATPAWWVCCLPAYVFLPHRSQMFAIRFILYHMIGDLFNNPVGFLYWVLALVIAITIHEFSHAFTAEHLGDPTPRLMGRLTLNPLAHLDPIGTLMLILVRFGWGKPVVFDPFNLRNPRRDSAIISLAGPFSNLVLAILCAIIIQILFNLHLPLIRNSLIGVLVYLIIGFLQPLIIINVILAVFNLIPVHPLDGFKIVQGILPEDYARQWAELEGYGMIFLIFLVFPILGGTAPINVIISPVINFIVKILLPSTPLI